MATTTFLINDAASGSTNPAARVTIAENADGTLTFNVVQLISAGAYLGDLRGFFFDLADESLIGSLQVTTPSAAVTEVQQGDDTVTNLGQGANMNGLLGSGGGYDVGVEIGTNGIANGDDVRSFSFTLDSSLRGLTLDDFATQDFGVRIASVGQDTNGDGTIDTSRTLAAKIGETVFDPVTAANDAAGNVLEDTSYTGNVLSNDTGPDAKVLLGVTYDGDTTGFSGPGPIVITLPSGATVAIYSNGQFTIDANPANSLAEDQVENFDISYVVQQTVDGDTATDEAHLTGTITGANDGPVIGGTATGGVMEDFFAAPTVYGTGGNSPYDFTVADVNGDGNADIVTTNLGSGNVAVLLGDGTGGFAAPTTYDMGLAPDTAVVADVNHDGLADIVTANGNNHSVSVLLADGAGGFAGPVTYASGLGYTQLVSVADVSGDGKLDIIASGDAGLSVRFGDGLGGFGAAMFVAAGVSIPASNAVVDVDGDGDADIIAAGVLSDNIAVLLNDGSGVFGSPTLYAAGGNYPQNLVAADVNGDGDADIVTANGLSDDVSVLLGDGNGGFGAAIAYDVGADFPGDVSVADVNGDGKADIVTSNVYGDNVSVLLGDGSGGFAAPILHDVGGTGPVHSALADVNGDGTIDIVTTNYFGHDLSVLLNNGGTASGTLAASDVDNGATQTWSIQGSDTGTYGSLALDGNSGEWTYTLANASEAVQSLAAGESQQDTFTVRVTDDHGAYDEQTVTITVEGADDFSFFSFALGNDAGAIDVGGAEVRGSDFADIIVGSAADEHIMGFGGNDTFVFSNGGGNDTIQDFAAGSGVGDVLDLSSYSFADFDAAMLNFNDSTAGLVFAFGSDTLTLESVLKTDIVQDVLMIA